MKARVGVVLAMLVGVVPISAPPAGAVTAKSISFVGTWTMRNCQGLGFPVLTGTPAPVPTVSAGPKGEPQVNLNPNQGHACAFELASTTCVKTSVGTKAGPLDQCRVLAAGSVWGFCGFATGTGTAGIINLSGGKGTVTIDIRLTFAGAELLVSGGDAGTNLHGSLAAVPTSGSCADGSATTFTVAGTSIYKDLS